MLAILMTISQTYFLYKVCFRLEGTTLSEELLMLLNPMSAILLVYSIHLLLKPSKRQWAIIIISAIFSTIMVGNALFYKFYNDVLTLPVLLQKDNSGGLGSSVANLFDLKIAMLLINIPILLLVRNTSYFRLTKQSSQTFKRSYVCVMAGFYIVSELLAFSRTHQFFIKTYDHEEIVKTKGLYQFVIYDVYLSLNQKTQHLLASEEELIEVEKELGDELNIGNHLLEGIAEGKNVIIISLESLQSFVIGLEVNGEEVTPFLNDYLEECYYFDQFYQQTGQGKTSDAEFIIENSLFGSSRGSAYFEYDLNTYENLGTILKEQGYYTTVFHANEKEYWNRDDMYVALGIMKFYDETAYDVTEENSIGWGLKDEDFFLQTIDYLKELEEPFYSKLITLTNHYPFELPESEWLIEPATTDSDIVNRYITTVRYLDESLKTFIETLKETDLYDNSIIVMYGDHYGLSESYNDGVAQLLGKSEITALDYLDLQRVPLIIHLPSQKEGAVVSKLSGQVDVKPTLLNLLGYGKLSKVNVGSDIFSANHGNTVAFRDGSFINTDYAYVKGICYDRGTKEAIESSFCEDLKEEVVETLSLSDLILNGDLLRFE